MMKKNLMEFCRRGLMACGFGPIVLAILYLILHRNGAVESLSVPQVCLGIFSLTALAFVAGGMNIIYQIERLPLMAAILIHGIVLYVSYLTVFLLNGWLERGWMPILFFSAIFLIGYLIIWAAIYCITRKNTAELNRKLRQKQQAAENR